jgi:hypothetical protein
MKLSFVRDIPRGAAAVVVALALIAGAVVGRDGAQADSPADRTPEPAPAPTATAAAAQTSVPDLDLEKLNRSARSGEITDLFAPKTAMLAPAPAAPAAVPPLPAPPPEPPPAPTAPPLPFRYFGKWVDGEKTVAFLWRNNEGYSVAAGETVDGYRVEAITDSSIDFTYLPLGSKQTLPITEPN